MATLIQVVDRARSLLNEALPSGRTFPDDTSTFYTDSELTEYANLIQEEVAQELVQIHEDFFVTQTSIDIVNGQAAYNLPSDFDKMRRVEDARGVEPIEIVPIRLGEKGNRGAIWDRSNSFWGGGYYIRGNQIVFDATPTYTQASGIVLHYVKVIQELTTGSSVSELPTAHASRVLTWGIVKLALFKSQADTARADAEFEKHLARLRNYALNRVDQRTRTVLRRRKY